MPKVGSVGCVGFLVEGIAACVLGNEAGSCLLGGQDHIWTTKQRQTHRLRERTYGYQGGEGCRGGIDLEFGIDMYTLCLK